MYYTNKMEDRVRIPPAMFGSKIEDAVLRILREKYERRIFKELGIILSIDDASIASEGIVIPGDAGAYYTVQFDALTFMPYVNEVYKAEIKEVVEFGAFASIGPFQGLVHISQIGRDKYYYDKKSKSLTSRAAKKSLKKGDSILVKVSTVSLKPSTTDTKIGLTMRPDGLGKDEWLEKEEKPEKKEKKEKAAKAGG
ncbi:DNA-directed RNA polymerase [Candidatus Micrarchaeota archaeon]|nr:DNA-directed RNA polymerase [Candidatus Micrarchaeota archaeon]